MWFYAAGGTSQGPVNVDQLVAMLRGLADPAAVQVWREGMTGWQPAGAVGEVASRLAPPVPMATPPASTPHPDAVLAPDGETPVATILAVARYYRRLILLVVAEIVVCWPMNEPVLNGTPGVQTIAIALLVLLVLGLAIPMAIAVHPLMSALDEGNPALWAIAMFLPVVNLVTLLVISSKTQAWFRQRSVHVGLLGPSKVSLDWIRRG